MEPAAVDRPSTAVVMKSTVVGLFLTVIFYYFSFPPFPTAFLAWISLVPFLMVLEMSQFQNAFRTGYLAGLFSTGAMMFWLNANTGATPFQASGMYLGAVMYLALWWGAFALIQKWFYQRWGARSFFLVPLVWTSLEYFQSLGELGFTWHSLSTSQTSYLFAIQFAEFTGMHGVTFWVVSLNVGVFFLLRAARRPTDRRSLGRYGMGLLILAVLPFIYGLSVVPERVTGNRWMKIGIVQPNIEPNVKWLDRDFAYDQLMNLTRGMRGDSLDLIIWPETAVPNRLRLDRRKLDPLRREIQAQGVSLLTGFPDRRFVEKDKELTHPSFNSVMLLRPDTDTIPMYDKIHLVPFGEHIPSFLNILAGIAMDVGEFGYTSGDRYTVFTVPTQDRKDSIRVSAVICLESIYPERVRQFIIRGAEVLVIVTNDAWYDGTNGPEQHARCAIYRAIENRISIARSANTGISCFIDPYGRMVARTQNGEQTTLHREVPILSQPTFFTRFGNIFSFFVILLTSLFLVMSCIPRMKSKPRNGENGV